MIEDNLGYHEYPKNGEGVIQAKTTGRLRSWELPRSLKALETLNKELGKIEFPSVYILFDSSEKKAYVGEAKNIYNRLKAHINAPEDKIKEWDKVLIINDGRPAMQSDFNDSVIRKSLELYLIKLFTTNKYSVISQGEGQRHNPMQKFIVNSLIDELNFFLLKKNLIGKLIEKLGQEEVFGDDLQRLIQKQGMKIEKWTAYEAIIDGKKAFIRPGSKKERGWQITFRGRKPGSFIDALERGEGYLLVSRDGILLIPLQRVQEVIADPEAYGQDTIDIWVTFKEEKAELRYKNNILDVSNFKLIKK